MCVSMALTDRSPILQVLGDRRLFLQVVGCMDGVPEKFLRYFSDDVLEAAVAEGNVRTMELLYEMQVRPKGWRETSNRERAKSFERAGAKAVEMQNLAVLEWLLLRGPPTLGVAMWKKVLRSFRGDFAMLELLHHLCPRDAMRAIHNPRAYGRKSKVEIDDVRLLRWIAAHLDVPASKINLDGAINRGNLEPLRVWSELNPDAKFDANALRLARDEGHWDLVDYIADRVDDKSRVELLHEMAAARDLTTTRRLVRTARHQAMIEALNSAAESGSAEIVEFLSTLYPGSVTPAAVDTTWVTEDEDDEEGVAPHQHDRNRRKPRRQLSVSTARDATTKLRRRC